MVMLLREVLLTPTRGSTCYPMKTIPGARRLFVLLGSRGFETAIRGHIYIFCEELSGTVRSEHRCVDQNLINWQ